MKIKLKTNISIDNLSVKKEYEIISILYIKWDLSDKNYTILYYIINDINDIFCGNESDFIITDSKIESDFIYEEKKLLQRYTIPEQLIASYALHPRNVDVFCLYKALEYTEPIEMDKEFCERFKHLLPEYKYAECFEEKYQDPNLNMIAEPIGQNWVLCPECNEAFEVDEHQGVITCTNVACKVYMNNPYAKKFPSKELKISAKE